MVEWLGEDHPVSTIGLKNHHFHRLEPIFWKLKTKLFKGFLGRMVMYWGINLLESWQMVTID